MCSGIMTTPSVPLAHQGGDHFHLENNAQVANLCRPRQRCANCDARPGPYAHSPPPGDRGQRQQRRRDDGCDDADTYADEFKLLT